MIGGNTELVIKVLDGSNQNFDKNGKKVAEYKDVASLFGWLDLISGDSKYDYKAKIEESTHVFLCDYIEGITDIDIEEAKAEVKGKEFDIKYIDDPMGMHEQLEIYLKLVGGQ